MKSGLGRHCETFLLTPEIEDVLGMSQVSSIVSPNCLALGPIRQFSTGQGVVSASSLSDSSGAVHRDGHDAVRRTRLEFQLHRPDRGVPLLTILGVGPDTVTHCLALALQFLGGKQFLARPLDLFSGPWPVLFHLKWTQS